MQNRRVVKLFRWLEAISFNIILMSPLVVHAEPYLGLSYSGVSYQRDNVRRAIGANDENYKLDVASEASDERQCLSSMNTTVEKRPCQITSLDENLKGFSLKYGYSFNRWVAIEGRVGFGVGEAVLTDYREKIKVDSGTVPISGVLLVSVQTLPRDSTLKMKHHYGLFLRLGGDRLSRQPFSPYLLVGRERVVFDAGIDTGNAQGALDGLSKGLGANVYLSADNNWLMNIEYRSLHKRSQQFKFTAVTAGFEYRF